MNTLQVYYIIHDAHAPARDACCRGRQNARFDREDGPRWSYASPWPSLADSLRGNPHCVAFLDAILWGDSSAPQP